MPRTVLGCPVAPPPQVLDAVLDPLPSNGRPVLTRSRRSAVALDALGHVGAVPWRWGLVEDPLAVRRLAA